ncbi:nitroreductase [Neisseria chenwenguii]|uniref:nitroreductase n=1 Tax=Neisseria chenwenguii TaxID=1853278 RepID=UPI0018F72259|nr:nitroreductase [Neisseria chenwenguii]
MLDFETTVKTRQSIRQFLPTPMSRSEIERVLADAQNAPSACNTQPWHVHIVSGETLRRVGKVIAEKFAKQEFTPDFEFDQSKFGGIYEPRWRNQYKHIFTDSFGVAREDKEGRAAVIQRNAEFYGAPHVAFLFMPSIDNHDVNVAADMGMYSQTFMLSLTARGFGSIPMLFLGLFADDIRCELGVSDEFKLLHGISFGHPDWDAMPNQKHLGRVPVNESAVLHW